MTPLIYTYTDEAPALATHSLLPILQAFARPAGVAIEQRDISLAARILARFDLAPDDLAALGKLAKDPSANIVKLPNISASVPQLQAAIAELQAAGHAVPDYEQATDAYAQVGGSAVNPVLREGNSDRRAPASVKDYARKHPHSMGEWSADSATHVVSMERDDFRSTEKSQTMTAADTLRIEHTATDGTVTVLREGIEVEEGEIIDAAVMRCAALQKFLADQVADAKASGLLFSLHLKATMMKVSDPIIFGHAVRAYFAQIFAEQGDALQAAGAKANEGLGSVLAAAPELADLFAAAIETGPDLAMVDSDRGITNLHVPSDVIIDASMPAMIRASGQMWDANGEQRDTKAVIPDSSYAPLYAETIADCIANGRFDPATMGSTANVGLMAQKAEEYGSHDKTFEIESDGTVRVLNGAGETLLEHDVAPGDIWRACQTKDAPVRDWVGLAIARGRATGVPVVFWLDASRAHDAEVIKKVQRELEAEDVADIEIEVLDVAQATRYTLARVRAGEDTITATGNVLRDYLTDLFPILELGTSAKMLSIVPLMAGGGLFETGAGGSAPKHVQQLVAENHLRWDSLGEFLALAAAFEKLAEQTANPRAAILGRTLGGATGKLLENGRSPSRSVGELDNRGSHFYLALYWAEALAAEGEDPELAGAFAPLADRLSKGEERIVSELAAVGGSPTDIGGYYLVDRDKTNSVMRPSATFNAAIDSL